MSSCNFTIRFSGSSSGIINKAKTAIEGQGGSFNGNESAGSFRVQFLGAIAGSYTISGQEMNVNIDTKPMFISCSQIESFMKTQFGS